MLGAWGRAVGHTWAVGAPYGPAGITPLHLVAAMRDGPLLKALMNLNPEGARAAWDSALTADGLTPAAFAALAAQRTQHPQHAQQRAPPGGAVHCGSAPKQGSGVTTTARAPASPMSPKAAAAPPPAPKTPGGLPAQAPPPAATPGVPEAAPSPASGSTSKGNETILCPTTTPAPAPASPVTPAAATASLPVAAWSRTCSSTSASSATTTATLPLREVPSWGVTPGAGEHSSQDMASAGAGVPAGAAAGEGEGEGEGEGSDGLAAREESSGEALTAALAGDPTMGLAVGEAAGAKREGKKASDSADAEASGEEAAAAPKGGPVPSAGSGLHSAPCPLGCKGAKESGMNREGGRGSPDPPYLASPGGMGGAGKQGLLLALQAVLL